MLRCWGLVFFPCPRCDHAAYKLVLVDCPTPSMPDYAMSHRLLARSLLAATLRRPLPPRPPRYSSHLCLCVCVVCLCLCVSASLCLCLSVSRFLGVSVSVLCAYVS